MRLLYGLKKWPELRAGCVATIGNFDGVHRGHQALLAGLRKEADLLRLPMLVFLFEPQPSEYFNTSKAPARLSSLREKIRALEQCGVEYVYCLKFDKHIASMSALEFAERFLFRTLGVRHVTVGNDFRFGSDRLGDVALLRTLGQKYECHVHSFSEFTIAEERVSSTQVRLALHLGKLDRAAQLLGRTYHMCGRVIPGKGLARLWGVPTANLALHRVTLPMTGVFCVQVNRLGKPKLAGVANMGCRPTVDGRKNVLEIHLFDFDESIYGEWLQVSFVQKLRDEMKFPSVEDLVAQIHEDIKKAKAIMT